MCLLTTQNEADYGNNNIGTIPELVESLDKLTDIFAQIN